MLEHVTSAQRGLPVRGASAEDKYHSIRRPRRYARIGHVQNRWRVNKDDIEFLDQAIEQHPKASGVKQATRFLRTGTAREHKQVRDLRQVTEVLSREILG